MNLTKKLKGAGMILEGVGGIVLNEICGAIQDEPQTTYELSKLPKGYMIKGLGYVVENKNLIRKGENYINEYRLKQKNRQEIFSS